jgi:hypothetical protein
MTFGTWMSGMTQQFFAILLGGLIAVGWGRNLANWVDGVIADWRPNLVAYIDVPQSSGATANYYIGPPPPLSMPPGAINGLYYTLHDVPPGYTRYQFEGARRIHSQKQLFICMMTALQTQTGSHLVIGHLFAPSRNSWYPKEALGKFTLMTKGAW